MPVIEPYTERVNAQGGLNVQANPEQFGANVGDALQNVGQATQSYAETLYRNEVQNETTDVYVKMSRMRADWAKKLEDMSNETTPGDNTFVPRVMDAMNTDFQTLSQGLGTRDAQQTFARMQADMTSTIGQQAINIQSRLSSEHAKNQYGDIISSYGRIAAQDYTQAESLINSTIATINDPNTIFAKVPEATREALRSAAREQINYAAAQGFARQYPDAVLGKVPENLRGQLQNVIANQPPPSLPPNLGASTVKPMSQTDISSKAAVVSKPSQYDTAFKNAAELYNLDPRELKLRSVVESNLDPEAKSSQGALGIMQMTQATADRLGVNPKDPVASIYAAAKLIADYRKKAGGDMSKVDMMYYGGEGGTAWGNNTKQYAANMAALRNAVGLGSAVDPGSFAPSAAQQVNNGVRPKTGIAFIDALPADKFFAVLADAERYSRAYESDAERSRIETERNLAKQQDDILKGYLDRIVNPNDENGGAFSAKEVLDNPDLTYAQQRNIIDYQMARTRELASAADGRTNPERVRQLMLQIHATDEDPTKTYNMTPIMDAYKSGEISTTEMKFLRTEVEQLRDGNTNPFQKDVQQARNVVFTMLSRSVMGQAQPEVASDAAYRWDRDFQNQIEALRKANKDPRVLLDPTNPAYALAPARVQSFLAASQQTLGMGAEQVASGAAQPVLQPKLPNVKDPNFAEIWAKMEPGDQFINKDGVVAYKPPRAN